MNNFGSTIMCTTIMVARVAFCFLALACVSGCQVFFADFGVYDQDLINDPSTQEISRKILVAKQDLIVERSVEDRYAVLRITNPGAHYTPTVEQFRQHGKDWVYHDKRALEYKKNNGFFPDWIPQGIIEKGTQLYVTKIKDKYCVMTGMHRRIRVVPLSGCFKGKELALWCLVLKNDMPDPLFFEVYQE